MSELCPVFDAAAPVLGRVIAVDGARVSGRCRASALGVGSLVAMPSARTRVYGMVAALRLADDTRPVHGRAGEAPEGVVDIELVCEATGGDGELRVQRGVSAYPALGGDIVATTGAELATIYAAQGAAHVRIGSLYQDPALPAYVLTDELLGKHFSVLGTSGSGKSCTVALILHAILAAHGHGRVILLDPHNEYAHAFGERAEVINPGNLHLPYWLLDFEEITEVVIGPVRPERQADVAILKAAIVSAKHRFHADKGGLDHITVDTPVPYRFGDLVKAIEHAVGKLDKPDGAAPYLRLLARLEALRSDRRFAFMFSGFTIADTMATILGRLLRIPVDGRPVSIVDLSGVPSEIVDAVVSVLCRMIFDFALWCARPQAFPVLLVCEEAHRYASADAAAGFGPTRRSLARIAREGRKYGVSLGLVSQRPSELDPAILSQCNTLFALRMSNERDHRFVHDALPDGSAGLLGALPSLRAQEAIVVGEGVTVPMRVRIDDLAPAQRPQSATARFSAAWDEDSADHDLVAETIERWRRQIR